jgi:hypothetical protein
LQEVSGGYQPRTGVKRGANQPIQECEEAAEMYRQLNTTTAASFQLRCRTVLLTAATKDVAATSGRILAEERRVA